MWIRIEPLDVLLFREARPFSAGENFRAAGQFPPTPLPLIGALRNAMMTHLRIDTQEYIQNARKSVSSQDYGPFARIGCPDNLGSLKVIGPFLVNGNNSLCLPLPKDLLVDKTRGLSDSPGFLRPQKPGWNICTSSPKLDLTLVSPKTGMEALEKGWLPGDFLQEYLLEDIAGAALYNESLVEEEARLGIELSPSRTAEFGRIYTVVFSRMEDKGAFLLWLESSTEELTNLLPKEGFLSLGGESRAAYFRQIEEGDDIPNPLGGTAMGNLNNELITYLVHTKSKRFKLYLLTPAIFGNGWLPDGIDETNYKWEPIKGVSVTLKAAAVGKAQPVGGWNLVKKAPRTLLRAVPAGSVYYFEADKELDEPNVRYIIEKIHFKSLMKEADHKQNKERPIIDLYRAAGFGLAALGIWKGKEE